MVDNGHLNATLRFAIDTADLLFHIGPERSAQRNAGAAATSASFVGFIDSDIVLPPTVVAEAVAAIKVGATSVVVPVKTVGEGFWSNVSADNTPSMKGATLWKHRASSLEKCSRMLTGSMTR
jgi:arabinofuranan 3-O-arabinosyltransferase